MKTLPAPRAALLVMRGERVLWRMGPGSGLPGCTQEDFERLHGELYLQGIPMLGLTAGIILGSEDRIVILTNFDEIEAARVEREQEQAAEDFAFGLKELFDEGLVSFVE